MTMSAANLAIVRDSGVRWMRIDFDWKTTESTRTCSSPPCYDFSKYDTTVSLLESHGLKAVFILDYGNPLYCQNAADCYNHDDGSCGSPTRCTGDQICEAGLCTENTNAPASTTAIQAYAKWAAAAVAHFKGHGAIWEMWNEPGGYGFGNRQGAYCSMAEAAGQAIHAVAPAEQLVGPAMWPDGGWAKTCLAAPYLLGRYWTAVTTHRYQPNPEDFLASAPSLESSIAPLPLFTSEDGYCTGCPAGNSYVLDDATQAKKLARDWLTDALAGVGLSIWYDLGDATFGVAPSDSNKNLHPRAAYYAAQTLTSHLRGYSFAKRLSGQSTDYLLQFNPVSGYGMPRHVAWSTSGSSHSVSLPLPQGGTGVARLTSYIGDPLPEVSAGSSGFAIGIDDGPVYVEPVPVVSLNDLVGVQMSGSASGQMRIHALSRSANFQQWLYETDAPSGAASPTQWTYVRGDYDRDGVPDLALVKMTGTGSGTTEVHILSGRSGFQDWLLHTPTALGVSSPSQYSFTYGDYNRDGVLDLLAVMMNGTGSGRTEVHVLDGARSYQQWLLHTSTALGPTTPAQFSFTLGDYNRDGIPDLVAVKMSGTASNATELHILDGAASYQKWLLEKPIPLGTTSAGQWQFRMGDYDGDNIPDLYLIKMNQTSSSATEVHILSGASLYQTWLLHTVTALGPTSSSQWRFP
jgi:hypothetical protein